MDTRSIRTTFTEVPAEKHLADLEERYRHEILDVEERLELRERIVRLRRKFSQRS